MRGQPNSAQARAKPLTICSTRRGVHSSEGDVVEEEERHRALDQDVVDAVGHEVVAHGVVDAGGDGHLDLGAHAVGGGHEHGLLVAREVGAEQAAEGADLREHPGVEGAAGQGLDARLGRVGRGDVDARLAVVHGRGSVSPGLGRSPSLAVAAPGAVRSASWP